MKTMSMRITGILLVLILALTLALPTAVLADDDDTFYNLTGQDVAFIGVDSEVTKAKKGDTIWVNTHKDISDEQYVIFTSDDVTIDEVLSFTMPDHDVAVTMTVYDKKTNITVDLTIDTLVTIPYAVKSGILQAKALDDGYFGGYPWDYDLNGDKLADIRVDETATDGTVERMPGADKLTRDYEKILLGEFLLCPYKYITFKFIKTYKLTIDYVYEGGGTVAASYTADLHEGDSYEVTSPDIAGYAADKAKVSGTMGTKDVTETVTYTKIIPTHSLTIDYVYEGGGEAAASYTATIQEGEAYEVASPDIAGYTVDKAKVSGTMGTTDVTETVTYTKIIPTHTLTIDYVYEGGGKPAESHSATVKEGEDYEVASPEIAGYIPDRSKVSGTMGTADLAITVTYTEESRHTHTYDAPTWNWAKDYKTATASFTCTGNDDTQLVDATVADPVITAASCTAAGQAVYTAKATFQGKEYSDTRTVKTEPATGHAYGTPEWRWADDFSAAKAVFTCPACDDSQHLDAKVTSEEIAEDEVRFTATVTFLEKTYTDEQILKKQKHTLTILYVDEDGAQAAEPHVEQVVEGAAYSVASPVLTRLAPDSAVVEGVMGTEDITVTVTYKDDICVITFMYNKQSATQTAWCGEATKLNPNPFKITSAYCFKGWNTEADGSGTAYADGAEIVPEGDMTLYAQVGRYYKLSFNANSGGKGSMKSIQITGGETIQLPKCTYVSKNDDLVFAGWTLRKDGSGTVYADEGEFTMPSAATKLYANWKGREVKLTFYHQKVDGKMDAMTVRIGDTVKLPANVLISKEGYEFGCWSTNKDGSGERYEDEGEIVIQGKTTLYPQWKGASVTVKFSAGGNTGKFNVTTPATITLPECQKTMSKKIFTGWLDSGKGVHAPGDEITVWNNMTLKAQWTKAGAITFNKNGGKGKMSKQYALPDTKIRLMANEFTRDGYEFIGWNTAKDGLGTAYKDKGSYRMIGTGSYKLYAQWQLKGAKLTLKKLDSISKSGKKQRLEATVTVDGKPVQDVDVHFSILGHTKKIKTDKNGVASWLIPQMALMEMTVDKKVTCTATHGNLTASRKVKVVE